MCLCVYMCVYVCICMDIYGCGVYVIAIDCIYVYVCIYIYTVCVCAVCVCVLCVCTPCVQLERLPHKQNVKMNMPR